MNERSWFDFPAPGDEGTPKVVSGKLVVGVDCRFGKNITINVAEECVFGDRCTVPDNAHIEGRRVTFGNDVFVGAHWGKRLEIGLNRRDSEHAVLTVGSRCTLHDNRIDLTRPVTLGDDVGMSPEVAVYTHGYWQSILDGYPHKFAPVTVKWGSIVGFRATLLPGAFVPEYSVVGAGAVVAGDLKRAWSVYAGVPARHVRPIQPPSPEERERLFKLMAVGYPRPSAWDYPEVSCGGVTINVEGRTLTGEEDERSDDLRWYLFTHGIRVFTGRRMKPMEGK